VALYCESRDAACPVVRIHNRFCFKEIRSGAARRSTCVQELEGPKTSVVVFKARVALLTQGPSACWLDVRKVAPSSNMLAWLSEGTSRSNSAKIADLSIEKRQVSRLSDSHNTIWFKPRNSHLFIRDSCCMNMRIFTQFLY
jgi:hypothetical protein